MALRSLVFIYAAPGFTPENSTRTTTVGECSFTSIGIDPSAKEQVVALASQAVADGAQMIEMCGGFGPIWIARVSEALGHTVPVGSTAYGPEAIEPMRDLFGPGGG